jgi:hypothetical protein
MTWPTNKVVQERRDFVRSIASAAGLALTGCGATGTVRGPQEPIGIADLVRFTAP